MWFNKPYQVYRYLRIKGQSRLATVRRGAQILGKSKFKHPESCAAMPSSRRASHVLARRPIVRRSAAGAPQAKADRKSTRLNSSHSQISYAVFCLKKKKKKNKVT